MKILFFSDVHWNTTSSVIRSRGEKYSVRLEHLIDSMNWVNDLADQEGCQFMICAGDFFDKAKITDEEITALNDIKWNSKECYFLCGNHESAVCDLRFNVLGALKSPIHKIVNTVDVKNLDDVDILFLPTIIDSDRKPLVEYVDDMKDKLTGKPLIMVSHNDLAGFKFAGGLESKTGFHIDEIQQNCVLYLNGHLHNSGWPTEKILNLGSFSAHNFTNDSFNYQYGVWILDTETLKLTFFENPYGFNFYTLEIWKESDFKKLKKLKKNAAVRIKCPEGIAIKLKDELEKYQDLILEKTITQVMLSDETVEDVDLSEHKIDYLAKLVELCKETITNSAILEEELSIICK